MLDELKYKVWDAARRMAKLGLVKFDWGSVSGINRDKNLFAIKPEGVAYEDLVPEQFVIIDLSGNIIEGENPAADWQTHLELYKAFPCGGIAHTCSDWATGFAASCKPIPAFGAIHADYFRGDIPATRLMTKEEIEQNYERNMGLVIAETFRTRNPQEIPAVLVSGHEPYTWGRDAAEAVQTAAVAEALAKTAACALTLTPGLAPVSKAIIDKRYTRRHK